MLEAEVEAEKVAKVPWQLPTKPPWTLGSIQEILEDARL